MSRRVWRECLNVTYENLPLQRPLSDIKQSLARVGSRSAPWTRRYPDRGGGSLGGSLHNTSSLSPFSRTFLMNVSHSCIFAFSLQCHTKDLRRSGHVITPSDSRLALLTCPVLSCPSAAPRTPRPKLTPLAHPSASSLLFFRRLCLEFLRSSRETLLSSKTDLSERKNLVYFLCCAVFYLFCIFISIIYYIFTWMSV